MSDGQGDGWIGRPLTCGALMLLAVGAVTAYADKQVTVRYHYDRRDSILAERRISERQTWDMEIGAATSDVALQATLNRALAGFVSKIVTDPDIDSVLTRPSQMSALA